MLAEAGVQVLFEAQIASATKRGGSRLTRLLLESGDAVEGRVFIEASYEGDLLAAAGVSTIVGREASSTYGEALAGVRTGNQGHEFAKAVNPYADDGSLLPLVNAAGDAAPLGSADARVQAYNFRLCVTRTPNASVAFRRPPGYDPRRWELLRRVSAAEPHTFARPSCNTQPVPRGKWDANNCGPVSTDFVGASEEYVHASHAQRRVIWQAHREYTEGLLYTLVTDRALKHNLDPSWGYCADEFDTPFLRHFPPALYVRAARRLVGDFIFTQNTPAAQRKLPSGIGNESIGLGCYNFDSHTARRMACHKHAGQEGDCLAAPAGTAAGAAYAWNEGDVETPPGTYQIPYAVVLPKRSEASNLLVVSAPSASHIGMSTLRMEPQFMIIGGAVGAAAAIAVARGVDVHDVPRDALNAALRADGQLVDLPTR